MTRRSLICAGTAFVMGMGLPVAAIAAAPDHVDPALRQALVAAMSEPHSFDGRYAAEVWFVDMSGRLAPFMPDPARRMEFLKVLHQEATRAGIEPELVLALIQVESAFKRYAISRSGAEGYMQVMPFWLKEVGDPDGNLFDLRTNLRMGCTILKYYIDKSNNDWVKALARYNGSAGLPNYPYKVLTLLNTRWSPN